MDKEEEEEDELSQVKRSSSENLLKENILWLSSENIDKEI